MGERLFVYGTLAPGRPNDHILGEVPGSWEEAFVQGRLVEHGWGAELGFPAIELSDDDSQIAGLVFTSDSLAEHWQRLDELEGEGERVVAEPGSTDSRRRAAGGNRWIQAEACLRDGRHVRAHLYVARGPGTR